MTDKPTNALEMTREEFRAARARIDREGVEQRMAELRAHAGDVYVRQRFPDHTPRALPQAEAPQADDEASAERLEQIRSRNAEIDAEVTAQVRRYLPHLFADGDRKPGNPKGELDQEVADAAEAFLRSKGK